MNIDQLIDSLIDEDWQSQIKKELKHIDAKDADQAIAALKQIMGNLTKHQIEFAKNVISQCGSTVD